MDDLCQAKKQNRINPAVTHSGTEHSFSSAKSQKQSDFSVILTV